MTTNQENKAILDSRLAKGEINIDEYNAIKSTIFLEAETENKTDSSVTPKVSIKNDSVTVPTFFELGLIIAPWRYTLIFSVLFFFYPYADGGSSATILSAGVAIIILITFIIDVASLKLLKRSLPIISAIISCFSIVYFWDKYGLGRGVSKMAVALNVLLLLYIYNHISFAFYSLSKGKRWFYNPQSKHNHG